MHQLVLKLTRQAEAPALLARLQLDEGALLACFARGAARGTAPLWIAKIASSATGGERLAAEAKALRELAPWAGELGIPRLLAWEAGSAAGEACLIQSGLSGQHPALPLQRGAWTALAPAWMECGCWLMRFQRSVPAPCRRSLAELAQEAARRSDRDAQQHPELGPLLLGLGQLLAGLLEQAGGAAENVPGVATHGDFWAGNILRGPRDGKIQVVDWSGYGAGSALQDLLTAISWIAPTGRLEGWRAAYFTPGRMREWLRDWARGAGYEDRTARLAFYHFLLVRMSWELGLRLQHRSAQEVAGAQRFWHEALSWLSQHRFPDPFTPLPVV